MSTPDAEQRSHREAIFDLLHRYATGIDTKDWALLASCFTPDASARYRSMEHPDRAVLMTFLERAHADLDGSMHRMSNICIDEIDGRRATVTTYVDALLVQRTHAAGPTLRVAGRYRDELAFDGEWRIRRRDYDPLWTDGSLALLGVELS